MLYVSVVSDLAIVGSGTEISEVEIDDLIDKLYRLYTNYKQGPEINIELLIFRLSAFLAQTEHTQHLGQISELFNDVILSSARVNTIFVNYYGKKVLGLTVSNNEYLERYYSKFNHHVEYSKTFGSDVKILPMLALVSFHITGQIHSDSCDELVQHISKLSATDRAQFLINLVMNTNNTYKNQIDDYTISQVTERFMRLYKNELEQIIYSSGVKESILEWYKTQHSDKEIGKYRYVLNYLYNLGL